MHRQPPFNAKETRALRIEVFGFDVTEVSQIRRIRALLALGHDVNSFTMRRDNMNANFVPEWPNTHLFTTKNKNLLKRVGIVAASILKSVPHRSRLRKADIIIARNLDMLAIAWSARQMAGAGHVPLVYECLDINAALCREDSKGKAMRATERFLLRRVDHLVVSSSGFMRQYFEPVQHYHGPWSLWENKLAAGSILPPRARARRPVNNRLRIGLIGTIRCAPSLDLLASLADRMSAANVQIHIHGVVHRHAIPNFDKIVAARENVIYHGPYDYPAEIGEVYANCDLVWAQDLWQLGNNSDWLLPNRIYEASWAGCPSIALAQTETGRRITQDNLGWVFDVANTDSLAALLRRISPEDIDRRGRDLLSRPDGDFVQMPEDISGVLQAVAFARSEAA